MGGSYVSDYSEDFHLLHRVDDLERSSVGSSGRTLVTVTGDYYLEPLEICLVNATRSVTITLPAAEAGELVTVKNIGSSLVTLVGASIDRQPSFLIEPLVSIVAVCDGTAWWVL